MHLEIAKCQIQSDFIMKSKENVDKVLKLDYGLIETPSIIDCYIIVLPNETTEEYKHRLRPLDRIASNLKRRLTIKSDLYKDPESVEEKAVLLIEKASGSKQSDVRISYLKDAIKTLSAIEISSE